ncbi:MAG: hypothetical protein Unbinned1007contig1000_54 [Prokaryotic dsDNA virus sp.]|nr:MAG: hypothetical protein Unbinned1007contig1000_54 [Prokaryotic dsDNA virus sp.]
MQSYYPNIWPSYSTIAKDAGMCRTKVIHTVEQLCSLGWLQKINRAEGDGQKTNAYRVTVWHECRVPTPHKPSIEAQSISATSSPDTPARCISATRGGTQNKPEVKQPKLKQKTKKVGYTEKFESFWKKYQSQNNKCVSQSKKPAFKEWQQLEKTTQDKLEDALEADSRLRVKLIRDGKFVPMWPDCFRWIKNGQYEQFLELREAKSQSRLNPMLANKASNQPF